MYQGSGKWSYGGPGKTPSKSDYVELSEDIVYVTNIPMGVTSKDLHEIFEVFGEIGFCRLQIDN